MHAKPDLRVEFEPVDHFSGSVIFAVIFLGGLVGSEPASDKAIPLHKSRFSSPVVIDCRTCRVYFCVMDSATSNHGFEICGRDQLWGLPIGKRSMPWSNAISNRL